MLSPVVYWGMSQPRIVRPECLSFYHVYSRVVDRVSIFGESEKRFFLGWVRKLERFCGVQVVTHCLMSNHFHLLVRVPEKGLMPMLDEAGLRDLLPIVYVDRQLADALQELDAACSMAAGGSSRWLGEILERYHARRFDLSSFVKELKQRFTMWFNARKQRVGTLWEDKFHSVLVEGEENTLLTMAAYIDLNPVRAGLVSDPKDYRWCGYGEAVAGGLRARCGLVAILKHTNFEVNREVTWREVGARYRVLLYGHGEQRDVDHRSGSAGRTGMSREEVARELARGGELSVAQVLRCKVRYFCDGAVLGTADFIDEVFAKNVRANGAEARQARGAARRLKGAQWGSLRVLRDLQKEVFG